MKSLAQKIALQFFLVLAVLVLGISIILVSIVGANIRKAKNAEINNALDTIIHAIRDDSSLYAAESELPYYITYTIYDEETKNITATNAPFIPILPESEKKPVVYLEKEFFTDGDLNLIYETTKIEKDKSTYVIQISNSLKEDEMFNLFTFVAPKVLATIFIPLLFIVSCGIHYRKTHTPSNRTDDKGGGKHFKLKSRCDAFSFFTAR